MVVLILERNEFLFSDKFILERFSHYAEFISFLAELPRVLTVKDMDRMMRNLPSELLLTKKWELEREAK